MPLRSWTILISPHVPLAVIPHTDWRLLPAGIFAGVFADILMWRTGMSHLFAVSVPTVLFALFFVTLMVSDCLAWGVSLWLGANLLAGAFGALVSMLAGPVAIRQQP